MVRVACAMMQKDESLLLEPWLRFHGYLFGFENLFLFDNGSQDQDVKETLRKFSRFGVNIDYSYDSKGDFDNKGKIVGNLISRFQEEKRYDIVFPMDCDEFVILAGRNGFSLSRNNIVDHIATLAKPGPMIKVQHCLDNRPGHLNLFRLVSFNKSVVPIGDFRSIDHGFHEAKAHNSTEYGSCKIVYGHFHFKPFELVKAHARDKLAAFVDHSNLQLLRSFSGVGRHLTRFFFMSEEEYYIIGLGKDYPYPLVKYNQLRDFLNFLMDFKSIEEHWLYHPNLSQAATDFLSNIQILEMPEQFDADAYVRANPDVGNSNMNPMIHYCLFGFREKRPLKLFDR